MKGIVTRAKAADATKLAAEKAAEKGSSAKAKTLLKQQEAKTEAKLVNEAGKANKAITALKADLKRADLQAAAAKSSAAAQDKFSAARAVSAVVDSTRRLAADDGRVAALCERARRTHIGVVLGAIASREDWLLVAAIIAAWRSQARPAAPASPGSFDAEPSGRRGERGLVLAPGNTRLDGFTLAATVLAWRHQVGPITEA